MRETCKDSRRRRCGQRGAKAKFKDITVSAVGEGWAGLASFSHGPGKRTHHALPRRNADNTTAQQHTAVSSEHHSRGRSGPGSHDVGAVAEGDSERRSDGRNLDHRRRRRLRTSHRERASEHNSQLCPIATVRRLRRTIWPVPKFEPTIVTDLARVSKPAAGSMSADTIAHEHADDERGRAVTSMHVQEMEGPLNVSCAAPGSTTGQGEETLPAACCKQVPFSKFRARQGPPWRGGTSQCRCRQAAQSGKCPGC